MRRVLFLTFMLAAPCSVVAQGTANDHSAVINASLKAIGGIGSLGRAQPSQVATLGRNLLLRGQFLLDLYEFHRLIVRDYALLRDSVTRAGGAALLVGPYMQARALQELGQAREAAAAYSRVTASAPERVRLQAAAWRATVSEGRGASWQQALTDWRAGRPVKPARCATDESACALFNAVLAGDVQTTVVLSTELLLQLPVDDRESLRSKGGTFTVEFVDPVVLFLLAAADYALAAHVLENVRGAEAQRGLALLRSGRAKEGEAVLRAAVSAGGAGAADAAPFLGEVLFRNGDLAGAEAQWQGASGAHAAVAWDSRISAGADASGFAAYVAEERRKGIEPRLRDERQGGVYLARALLRRGLTKEATEVLDAVRPPSLGTNLDRVRPDLLVLASRARYEYARAAKEYNYYGLARGDVAAIADDYAVLRPLLGMMQEISAPANLDPRVRTGP